MGIIQFKDMKSITRFSLLMFFMNDALEFFHFAG